jgi:hypothetical protein
MNKTQRMKNDGRPRGRGGGDVHVDSEVERLRQRFEKFRREHRSRTRIPDVLRATVLTALDGGASEQDVRRACGVTSAQLVQWRRQQRQGAEVSGRGEHEARVFEVVDEEPGIDMGSGGGAAAPCSPELELRLGGWAVRIQQLEA